MSDSSDLNDDGGAFVLLNFTGDCLDPASLISVIPLTPVRPKRKGAPLGPVRSGKVPMAKTGYCGFTTSNEVSSKRADDHAAFLLRIVSDHITDIRRVMSIQSLKWRAVLFEGHSEGKSFLDLSPELVQQAAELGLPLLPKGEEAMTIMTDVSQSEL